MPAVRTSQSFAYYALRPLRHFADFRGRSTRSELVGWYFASLFAAAVAHLAASIILLLKNDDPGSNRWGPNPRYDAPQTA